MAKRKVLEIKAIAGWFVVLWALTACAASPEYSADSPKVLVQPSKVWQKDGLTREEAQTVLNACVKSAKQDPQYEDLMKAARAITVKYQQSDEEERALRAPNIYAGQLVRLCMTRQGFFYGKYKS